MGVSYTPMRLIDRYEEQENEGNFDDAPEEREEDPEDVWIRSVVELAMEEEEERLMRYTRNFDATSTYTTYPDDPNESIESIIGSQE